MSALIMGRSKPEAPGAGLEAHLDFSVYVEKRFKRGIEFALLEFVSKLVRNIVKSNWTTCVF